MIVISTFLVLIFCCSIGAQSTCLQASTDSLPDGCKIGNLMVISTLSLFEDVIVSNVSCGQNTSAKSFKFPPRVFLPSNYSLTPNSNITYLLTVVDRTHEKLLWMVSDLTLNQEEEQLDGIRTVMPLTTNNPSRHRIITAYSEPDVCDSSPTIEFLVFEEYRRNVSLSYANTKTKYSSPFSLSAWIDAQQNSGITICGPVAGGSVRVMTETAFYFPDDEEFYDSANIAANFDNGAPQITIYVTLIKIGAVIVFIIGILLIIRMLKIIYYRQQISKSNKKSDPVQLENAIPIPYYNYPAPQ